MNPSSQRNTLRFLWWNVQDFAHYDPTKASKERWPESPQEYREKQNRVARVLEKVSQQGPVNLLAFSEITHQAAVELRDRLFPGYHVHLLGEILSEPDFQVTFLFDSTNVFSNEDYRTTECVPKTVRPMITLDHVENKNRIRFYACHWTARFDASSEKWRNLSAQTLGIDAYEFIRGNQEDENRHIVILGDFNDEPFGMMGNWLYAVRDRSRTRTPKHYTDETIRRVWLYNCSWKLLGESSTHPLGPNDRDIAGTYFWRDSRTWHTYDQVIVSGSLLTTTSPYLDEKSIRIVCRLDEFPDDLLGEDGLPDKFSWNRGRPKGVSDHFPIVGSIVLQ